MTRRHVTSQSCPRTRPAFRKQCYKLIFQITNVYWININVFEVPNNTISDTHDVQTIQAAVGIYLLKDCSDTDDEQLI